MSLFNIGRGLMSTTNFIQWYLEFDGINDIVLARDSSVFDVDTGDFEFEIYFRTTTTNQFRIGDKRGQGGLGTQMSYQISTDATGSDWGNTLIENEDYEVAGAGDFTIVSYDQGDGEWHKVMLKWTNLLGKAQLYIDNILVRGDSNSAMIGRSISNNRKFSIGGANTLGQFYQGDIRYFRFNTEMFEINEGIGSSVITGSEGTILDINGATWQQV